MNGAGTENEYRVSSARSSQENTRIQSLIQLVVFSSQITMT